MCTSVTELYTLRTLRSLRVAKVRIFALLGDFESFFMYYITGRDSSERYLCFFMSKDDIF